LPDRFSRLVSAWFTRTGSAGSAISVSRAHKNPPTETAEPPLLSHIRALALQAKRDSASCGSNGLRWFGRIAGTLGPQNQNRHCAVSSHAEFRATLASRSVCTRRTSRPQNLVHLGALGRPHDTPECGQSPCGTDLQSSIWTSSMTNRAIALNVSWTHFRAASLMGLSKVEGSGSAFHFLPSQPPFQFFLTLNTVACPTEPPRAV
jgi:hypothetical protein